MKAQVFFFYGNNDIFSLETDNIPKVGDTIKFNFRPKNIDVFSQDFKTEMDMISMKTFKVVEVEHIFTKKDVFENDHTIHIKLGLRE